MQKLSTIWLILILVGTGCGGNSDAPDHNDRSIEPKTSDPVPRESTQQTKANLLTGEEVVTRFVEAIKAADVDRLMELTDVPFWADGKMLVTDEKVKSHYKRMIKNDQDPLAQMSFKIRSVTEFNSSEAEGEIWEILNLEDGDPIVVVDFRLPNGKTDRHAYFVRKRETDTKIVAERDVH